jgi:hypothetical protein
VVTRAGQASLLVWVLVSGSIGCERIVGIEAAYLDPALVDGAVTGPSAACSEFCATVMQNCTGDFAVYQSAATCQAVCAHLPPGSPGDTEGDTVYCRLHCAQLAASASEPNVYCPAAAPGGSGVCGSDCEAYCVLLEQICPAHFGGIYRDSVDCNARCGAWPSLGAFDLGQSSGNSVNCRLWHVSAAALDPETQCGYAAGDPPC